MKRATLIGGWAVLMAVLVVVLVLISFSLVAQGWTLTDCEEANFDHPDCDQFLTTTTGSTTTAPTTTTGQVTSTTLATTTTTEVPPSTTSTVVTHPPSETTPTTPSTPTTIAECPPGLVHTDGVLCTLPSTVPAPVSVPAAPVVSAPTTPAGEETLPFTGDWTLYLVPLALVLIAGGYRLLKAAEAR